ncbi:MAG: hypothetical protein LBL51_02735 [Synergistaceae bacterium]|jgi:predicted RNase H-like HicB family nuclease|nr:hypothetical protein [Synergistaceae bacterium]
MLSGFEEITAVPVKIGIRLKYSVNLEYDEEDKGYLITMPDLPEAQSYLWPGEDASEKFRSLVETVLSGYQDFQWRFPVPVQENVADSFVELSEKLSEDILEYNQSFAHE